MHEQPLLQSWTESPLNEPQVPLDLVHKRRPENLALSRFAPLDEPHTFAAEVLVDTAHPFFFDHPLDHAPGLLLIEAARQFGIAVAHRHYGVPFDHGFILNGFDVDFARFAELGAPVFILGRTTDRVERKGVLSSMTFTGHFQQEGRELGRMSGRWRMVPRRILARLRKG